MQPKSDCNFIYDATNGRWVPWEGTPPGFGGVTLYTFAGNLIDTPQGQGDAQGTTWLVGVGAFNYAFSDSQGSWNRIRDITPAEGVNNPTTGVQASIDFPMVWNGATWDRAASISTAADNAATSTTGYQGVGCFLFGFDGATWDRLRSFAGNADALAAPTLGLLGELGFNFVFNGATYDRQRSLADNADAVATGTTGLAGGVVRLTAFNNATYDRIRVQSNANAGLDPQLGVALAAPPANWSITHAPAANTQATISRAAVNGSRHICTSISATLSAQATATSGDVQVNLRDGATGAGTILWSQTVRVGGAGGAIADRAILQLSGLSIVGSNNTAMTLEFSAAGGANTFESVALTGYDTA